MTTKYLPYVLQDNSVRQCHVRPINLLFMVTTLYQLMLCKFPFITYELSRFYSLHITPTNCNLLFKNLCRIQFVESTLLLAWLAHSPTVTPGRLYRKRDDFLDRIISSRLVGFCFCFFSRIFRVYFCFRTVD